RAWGLNDNGQCTLPVPNTGFLAVAAGLAHSMGLKGDGSIVAWGRNNAQQLNVPSSNPFYAIAAGGDFGLALKGPTSTGIPSHPESTAHLRAFPNPSRGAVSIQFNSAKETRVAIKVFDSRGSLLREMPARLYEPGENEWRWDGRDNSGHYASTGIYFFILEPDHGHRQSGKVVIIH